MMVSFNGHGNKIPQENHSPVTSLRHRKLEDTDYYVDTVIQNLFCSHVFIK